MSKTIIQTTVSLDFDEWVSQAKRFASISDVVNENNMPLDVNTSTHATIEISHNLPLYRGFFGNVIYYQNYTQVIDQVVVDNQGNLTNQTEQVTVNRKHKVIDYNLNLDVATIDALLSKAITQVPSDVTGYISRQNRAIGLVALQDIISHHTFNLEADKWVIS